MKFFWFLIFIFSIIFTGCNVDVVSRADSNKVYASGAACAEKWQDAKVSAIKDITQHYPLIEDELKHYIGVQKVDGNGTVCYEAFITAKKWSHYEGSFEDERKEIIRHSKEYVQIFEYKDKDVLINTLLTERQRFNDKLNVANSIAPVKVEPFKEDYQSLENSINLLPTVHIEVQSCNRGSNYQCMVTYRAKVKDESQELSYLWNFGDGVKSEAKNAQHRYENEGSYSVSLQVTDESGLSSFIIEDVQVLKGTKKQKPVAHKKNTLSAYFILNKKYYKVGEKVYFDNRSKAKGSTIARYHWEFGDGKTALSRNPRHAYEKAGRYIVKYQVCNHEDECAYASTRVKIVDASKYAKPTKKKVKKRTPEKVKKAVPKVVTIDAKRGESIEAYIAKKGTPSKTIIKKKASMTAYLYGDIWILAKRSKIECAVKKEGFSTSLMGVPKKCRWHDKNMKKWMVELSN